ncbi:40S ribosomal protein S6 [Manis javanica]|nr:40S ribosomal protein S6 [Manis javanica]
MVPDNGCQKLTEVDDECKLPNFYEKCMATEVSAGCLGEEWKDYVIQINDENDKQGFLMKQHALTDSQFPQRAFLSPFPALTASW